jgi:flagellar protein FlbD
MAMIRLTRLKHGPFLLNPDLIEHVEMTPDTVITLTTGHQFMVLESAAELTSRIIEFRREILAGRQEGSPPRMADPSQQAA